MFLNGLLLLSGPVSGLVPRVISGYLRKASELVNQVLYVQIDPSITGAANSNNVQQLKTIQTSQEGQQTEQSIKDLHQTLVRLIPTIYSTANRTAPRLDVRVLHPLGPSRHFSLVHKPEILMHNQSSLSLAALTEYSSKKFNAPIPSQVQFIEPQSTQQPECNTNESTDPIKFYDHTCLGGTFDGIHNGHKILLSMAALRANSKLTVGVTDTGMIQSKLLWELIAPTENRIDYVKNYLQDVDGGRLDYVVVPISDPFGPAIIDKDLGCLVVSQETERGGKKVNELRIQAGLREADLCSINLVQNEDRQCEAEEAKLSSSALRMRKLGTLLRPPKVRSERPKPYVVGLTGGVASGKSTIMSFLESRGYSIIQSDQLGHKTYASSDSPTYQAIVETFGPQVLTDGSNSPINRKVLGQIVFNDKAQLNKLNAIVWPAVRKLVIEQIQRARETGKEIVFFESALLLEAGWESEAHEIWLVLISEKEAVRRMVEQRGLSQEEACSRLKSQMPNSERVKHANIVLSSMWDVEFTRSQVTKALKGLHDRLTAA